MKENNEIKSIINRNTTDKDIINLCRYIYAWLVDKKNIDGDISLLSLANGEILKLTNNKECECSNLQNGSLIQTDKNDKCIVCGKQYCKNISI